MRTMLMVLRLARTAIWVAILLGWPAVAMSAEPVRQIGIHVQPFYEAAQTPDGRPKVAVGEQFNGLLGSNRREDILAARDLIAAKPAVVTPMTMMVLAVRLYDAVFWFYTAKERYIVMSEVLDVKTQTLAQADDAMRSFASLAGPIINGYAFCDLARQTAQHAKAVMWVEANPYEVMFMARAPALPGDRAANARRAIDNAKDRAAKERAYFDNGGTREAYYATRKQNGAEDKFCWK